MPYCVATAQERRMMIKGLGKYWASVDSDDTHSAAPLSSLLFRRMISSYPKAKGKCRMRKAIGLLLLTFAVQPMLAKEDWPVNITVLSAKNMESPRSSFNLSWRGGGGGAFWGHKIAKHAFIEASDGNSYDLVPNNPKDMLRPGTFKARIEKRDMKVCEPKDNGTCWEVKFQIVAAVPTVKGAEPTPETAGPTPTIAEPERDGGTTSATGAVPSFAVESTPSGADIEIDGTFVGNTPSTITISPGSHEIVVKKKGFADWTRKLSVTGGSIHINALLDPAPASQCPPQLRPLRC